MTVSIPHRCGSHQASQYDRRPTAVEEAIGAIAQARYDEIPILKLIVGQGKHSPGHEARIKPAIEQLMQEYVSPLFAIG